MKGLRKGRVSFVLPENKVCIKLADAGFSIKTIAKVTGLTPNQVIYRCGKKGLHISDYRNGSSPKAIVILSRYQILSKR